VKVKVGNQTFDSKDVPIAILLTEKERAWVDNAPPKPAGEWHLFTFWPGDINLKVVIAWLKEAVTELDIEKVLFGHLGRAQGREDTSGPASDGGSGNT
jgi:hypothetical protein